MTRKSLQIAGLVSIAVLGGVLVFRPTQSPEPEVMERALERPLAIELAAHSDAVLPAATPEPPVPDTPSPETTLPVPSVVVTPSSPRPAGAPLPGAPAGAPAGAMPGSQDARDDLYCWAVLGKEFEARIRTDPPAATPLLDAARWLESAGVRKLEAEGVTALDNWASLTVAFAEQARTDYRRDELHIPVEACVERASRLAPGSRPDGG